MSEQMAAECGAEPMDTPFENTDWTDLERRASEWASKQSNPFSEVPGANDADVRRLMACYWTEGYLSCKADAIRHECDRLDTAISRRSAEHRRGE